jgi:hypothetical protein
MTFSEPTLAERRSATIRRGLWILGFILAAGIGIAGFSIAASLLIV